MPISLHDIAGLAGPDLLAATTLGIVPGSSDDPRGSKMHALDSSGAQIVAPAPQISSPAPAVASPPVVSKGTYATGPVSADVQAIFDAHSAGVAAGTIVNTPGGSADGTGKVASIVSNPSQAAAAPSGQPDWNALQVGQTVNGGKVLDASVFQSQFLDPATSNGVGYTSKYGGASVFGTASSPTDTIGLGNALGSNSNIYLAGFKATDYGTDATSTGGDSPTTTPATWNTSALLSAASSYGIDSSTYKVAGTTSYDDSGAAVINPDTYDYDKLNAAVQGAQFKQAAANPNAVFLIDSQAVGADSHLSRNLTSYVVRGDRLVPIANQAYSQDSELKDTWNGVAPLAGIVASAFLGPEVSAFFGGGITGAAAAGAATGAVSSAISGQNVLKGAALGGLTGGLGAGASAAVGGGTLGAIASGATKGLVTSVVNKDGNAFTDVLSGAAGGAISGLNLGGNPVINQILKTGISQVISKQRGHP